MVPEFHDNIRDTALEQIRSLQLNCERIVQPILGHEMVWRRTGRGAPLVLLHGGHGCWLHWARVISELSSSFTLWLPDMPGFGESSLSPTPGSPQGLQELVSLLQQSLDTLLGAGTPIRLAGFSFGGLVAALLAARRDAVKSLVLVGPAGHGGLRRQTTVPLPWRDLDPELDPEKWTYRMRHNLLAQMLHRPAFVDALAMEIQWRGCSNTRFRSKPFSRSAALAPALRDYRGDVLTLWGEHDVTAHPDDLVIDDASEGALRHSVVIEDAGHWLMHESPEKTIEWMRNGFA